MSNTITDQIVSAGIELGEQIAGNVSNWRSQEQTMRDMIAAALADAERKEAEAMRAEIEAQEPGKQRNDITLNASQLRHALDFAAPDFAQDGDQREVEVSIGWRDAGEVLDDDGHPEPAGYVAWLTEYPEEGCIPLLESWESAPVPAQAVPDWWRLVLAEARDLFAMYADSHRARGPEHASKAARNEAMAAKISAVLAE